MQKSKIKNIYINFHNLFRIYKYIFVIYIINIELFILLVYIYMNFEKRKVINDINKNKTIFIESNEIL